MVDLSIAKPLMRGDAVVKVQQQLEAAGLNPGPVDGIYGTRTEQAVRRFQAKHGLRVDGVVGKDTRAALDKPTEHPHPVTPGSKGTQLREKKLNYPRAEIGIHEVPDGSNGGPEVHRIQKSTGALDAPWCVSTGQDADVHIGIGPYADRTANAYYYADYGRKHGHTVKVPVPGCAVVYHMGQGHYGTVETVYRDGSFDAIEGNEGNAIRRVHRDPRTIPCTFVLRPELRG